MMIAERRQFPRLEGNIPLKICGDDFDIVTETKNLSRNGAYCQVKKYLKPMTKLKICLMLPLKRESKIVTKKICCDGVIVRSEHIPLQDIFNVAIFFNDIPSRDSDAISEFISSRLSVNPTPHL